MHSCFGKYERKWNLSPSPNPEKWWCYPHRLKKWTSSFIQWHHEKCFQPMGSNFSMSSVLNSDFWLQCEKSIHFYIVCEDACLNHFLVCIGAEVCVCTCRGGKSAGGVPQKPSTCVLGTGSLTGTSSLPIRWGWLDSILRDPPARAPPPLMAWPMHTSQHGFWHGWWVPDSGPHACTVSTYWLSHLLSLSTSCFCKQLRIYTGSQMFLQMCMCPRTIPCLMLINIH